MKRFLDFLLAVVGVLALSPLLLIGAVAIKMDDGGSIFFRQIRIGQHGRPFRIWKFRTMMENAASQGRAITAAGDSRITRVGHFLRQFKVDELPQLFNVLAGTMSFVGPRPEVEKYVSLYDENQRQVLELRPGITDLASIKYRNESELLATAENPEEMYQLKIMPDKIRINLEYSRVANSWTDLQVILKTLRVL